MGGTIRQSGPPTDASTRAVWRVLTDDEEVQAISAENSDEQLKTPPKLKDKVTGDVMAEASDFGAMTEAARANAELLVEGAGQDRPEEVVGPPVPRSSL